MNERNQRLSASFRDPSGFLFTRAGQLYRQVNQVYQADYDQLMSSGLYQKLVQRGLLIAHEPVDLPPETEQAYQIIQPEHLAFISYPYEWSFGMLKDAALTTLKIQKLALQHGMSLKDSSAYNIQFQDGKPLLIDTLSFEIYREGEPWIAYRQYCQHFLAPLALMARRDIRLGKMLASYIDGIPLDLAASLLPVRTRFNPGLSMHIHLHATAQKRYADQEVKKTTTRQMSRTSLLGLIDSLQSTTQKLTWKPQGTEWGDYYSASCSHYDQAALDSKRQVVANYIERAAPRQVWDLGGNTGEFSRLASDRHIPTVAFDIDPAAVELNYRQIRQKKEKNLLPLVLDLTNPSPALGWSHAERDSLLGRGPVDAVLALALIHHLAIANNVPLGQLAAFFQQAGRWLILEFVPKEDSQVQILLANRADIFSDYHQAGFEAAFAPYFTIRDRQPVQNTPRSLYLLESKA